MLASIWNEHVRPNEQLTRRPGFSCVQAYLWFAYIHAQKGYQVISVFSSFVVILRKRELVVLLKLSY